MYSKNAPFRYDFVGSFLRPAPIKAPAPLSSPVSWTLPG